MEYDEEIKNYNDWFAITQTLEKRAIQQNTKEMAKKMKEEGIDLKIISEITGLGEEEIKNL